jgi:multidrug resistance efflux pump
MTIRIWTAAVGLLATMLGMGYRLWPDQEHAVRTIEAARQSQMETDELEVVFVAPGVTEPRSKAIHIVSELPGRIRTVAVRAGDSIRRGQLLVELDNEIQQAGVELARARLERAVANLRRLENGDREQERAALRSQLAEADAKLELAVSEAKWIEEMLEMDSASEREAARVRSELALARARRNIVQQRWELSNVGARWEDIAEAQAAVKEAEAQLESAKELLERTAIRSPIDGKVIYRHKEPGETVYAETPTPILTVGDCSALHIRVDVDEADIGKVRVGQKTYATVTAFGDRRFFGEVIHVEPTLGRKNFRTMRPTEWQDTKVQEVVVLLDDDEELPVELQMAVWFLDRRRHSPQP